mmetsp:Transcript_41943/g.48977  ORF Transcript_41943/g.48977 Transcript_41943/m.48977 type:complete len:226 (+) Transcript_41943:1068-1745(+)
MILFPSMSSLISSIIFKVSSILVASSRNSTMSCSTFPGSSSPRPLSLPLLSSSLPLPLSSSSLPLPLLLSSSLPRPFFRSLKKRYSLMSCITFPGSSSPLPLLSSSLPRPLFRSSSPLSSLLFVSRTCPLTSISSKTTEELSSNNRAFCKFENSFIQIIGELEKNRNPMVRQPAANKKVVVNESPATVTFFVIQFDISPEAKGMDKNTLETRSYETMEMKDRRKT